MYSKHSRSECLPDIKEKPNKRTTKSHIELKYFDFDVCTSGEGMSFNIIFIPVGEIRNILYFSHKVGRNVV